MAAAELVCSCPADVEISARVGADRVELCAALDVGGVTPGAGLLDEALRIAKGELDLVVLVRPRAGDFVLRSEAERRAALRDVEWAGRAGAQGVAVGALDGSGDVDVEFVRAAVDAAGPMAVTFHRAIDSARDPASALETLTGLGVRRILTSGGAESAARGAPAIAAWARRFGGAFEFIAAGGVTGPYAAEVLAASGAHALHGSCRAQGNGGSPPGMGRTPAMDEASARGLVEAAHARAQR